MKRKLKVISLALFLLVSSLLPLHASAEAGASFSLSISNLNPTVGDQFQVTVKGMNLSDVYAYEINLSYDSSLVELNNTVTGASGVGFSVDPVLTVNSIQIAHTLIGPITGQSGDSILSTLTFKAIAQGMETIQIANVKLVNSQLVDRIVASDSTVSAAIGTRATPTPTPSSAPTEPGSSTPGSSEPAKSTAEPTSPTEPTPKPNSVITKMTMDTTTKIATFTTDSADWDMAIMDAIADKNGKKTISIEAEIVEGAKGYVLKLPSQVISNRVEPIDIVFKTAIASIVFPSNMFLKNELTDGEAELHITQADINSLTHPAIELSIQSGGKIIPWKNPNAAVTISIPYTPTAAGLQDPEHIVIWYIDPTGKVNTVVNGKFISQTGQATFTTTHFSTYAVAFVHKTFKDIDSLSWAKKQIEVLASKEVVNGISETQFNPSKSITRADFLVLLVRTLELQGEMGSPFADVKETDYYNEPLRLARGLGITLGNGNNLFNPKEFITREDMMVLTDRALVIAGKPVLSTSASDLTGFKDAAAISKYALESINLLVKADLIQGNNGAIHPKETTTRAESAVLMYRILSL